MGHVKGVVVFPISTEDVGITFDVLGVFPALERAAVKMWPKVERFITGLKLSYLVIYQMR
jgi:hypothetical protein